MTTPLQVACPHCGTTNRVPADRLADGPACGQCKEALLPRHPVELGEADFDRQAKGDLPLVVDFWAEWCGPCKMMAPAFAEAAARAPAGVRFGKLDTEAHPGVAARFGIRSIPTMVLLRQGREVARTSGAMGAGQLLQWVESHVAGA
jgi:thioredoxin 2